MSTRVKSISAVRNRAVTKFRMHSRSYSQVISRELDGIANNKELVWGCTNRNVT